MKSAPRQVSILERPCLRDASAEMFLVLTKSQVLLIVNTNPLYQQEVDVKSRICFNSLVVNVVAQTQIKNKFWHLQYGILWLTTILRKCEWTYRDNLK